MFIVIKPIDIRMFPAWYCISVLIYFVCPLLFGGIFGIQQAHASNYWGGDAAAGLQQLQLSRQDEAEKKGFTLGVHLILETQSDSLGIGYLGLGSTYVNQIGATDVWQQRIETVLLTLDLGYLYPVTKNFFFGAHLRSQSGQGAYYDIFDLENFQTSVSAGPRIEYRIHRPDQNLQWVFGVSALQDFNVPDRSIVQIPVSFGIRYAFDSADDTGTASPIPRAVYKDHMMHIGLDSPFINFDRNQYTLRPEAQYLLSQLAEILVSESENWEKLTVSGHTDISGKSSRNQVLAHLRAVAVADFFIQLGVSKNKIATKGFSSSRLLPDLDPEDPKHRRVELHFSSVKNPERLAELFNNVLIRLKEKN